MTMEKHVNNISNKICSRLRRLRQVRQHLSKEATESLVISFVSSTFDYCNALRYGCAKHPLDKLQKVQNCAARVVTGGRKYDHVKPLLKALHWLPVAQRIDFQIALLMYKCINGFAPKYLVNLLEVQESSCCIVTIPRLVVRSCAFGPRAILWHTIPPPSLLVTMCFTFWL